MVDGGYKIIVNRGVIEGWSKWNILINNILLVDDVEENGKVEVISIEFLNIKEIMDDF